jgi:hypothetical protein
MKDGAAIPIQGRVLLPAGMSEACRAPTKRSEDGGAVFGVMVQIWGRIRVSRYNYNKLLVLSHGAGANKMRSGAVSRYKLTTKAGLSHDIGVLLRALVRRPGLRFKGICHEGTVCKNRDKQMHFIVRVSSFNRFLSN